MTTNAINGGAINLTSFPGAEDGLSLIELIGTVEVTGSISGITLRHLSAATTAASSSGTASTVKKSQLSIVAQPAATSSVIAYVKKLFDVSEQAKCVTSCGVGLTYMPSASATASASVSEITGYVATKRSAQTTCAATPSALAGKTHVFRGAVTTSTANASAAMVRKTPCDANGIATSAGIASVAFINRIGATAAPTADGAVATRANVKRTASTTASALTAADSRKNLAFALVRELAAANCAAVFSNRKISLSSLGQANAYANATIRLKHSLSASVTATAVAQSAASDFASAMPAPAERLMTVQASDRRMGVTE